MKHLKTLLICLSWLGAFSALAATHGQMKEMQRFKDFCVLADLRQCDMKAPIPSEEAWDVGLVTFKTIVDSPSKIRVTREQFDRPAVKKLISITGGGPIIGFINSIPWDRLIISSNKIDLTNDRPAKVTANGITLRGAYNPVFKIISKSRIEVSGLSMITRVFGEEQITAIDLSNPGLLTFETTDRIISSIPPAYLIPDNFPVPQNSLTSAPIELDELIRSIADVIFEKDYEWHRIIDIRLLNEHIRTIKELSYEEVMKNQFREALILALDNTKSVVIGGIMQSPLRFSIDKKIKCKMHIINIPVIGTFKASLKFDKSFGIASADKLEDGRVSAKLAGISTTIGNVKELIVEGDDIKLRVGKFTIPISGPAPEEGDIQLKEVECEED